MTISTRVVLHVGMPGTGARMIQRALTRLRPQLRRKGVAYLGQRALDQLEHRAGWRTSPACREGHAEPFEAEVATLARREVGAVARLAGGRPVTLLVSSDHLVGSDDLGPADRARFRPWAESAVSQLLRALEAESARLLLYTRRQDRLMELAYLRAVQGGAHHDFGEQFPEDAAPTLDYHVLLGRLRDVDRVSEVRVRPVEVTGGDARAYVDDFLAGVGLPEPVDLSAVGDDLVTHRTYSRRGLALALAANPHLSDDTDRRAVRAFLLENYGTSEDRHSRFLPERARSRILAAYRPMNERLFREHMPGLPPDSYASDEATARLAGALPPPPRRPRRERRRRARPGRLRWSGRRAWRPSGRHGWPGWLGATSSATGSGSATSRSAPTRPPGRSPSAGAPGCGG